MFTVVRLSRRWPRQGSLVVLVLFARHSRGGQLLHEELEGRHAGVPRGFLRAIKVGQLGVRTDLYVRSEMREHGGGDAPLCLLDALLGQLRLLPVEGVLGALGVHDLVEAREDITAGDMLE